MIKMHELSLNVRCVKMDRQSATLKHTSVTHSSGPGAAVWLLRVLESLNVCLGPPSPSLTCSGDHSTVMARFILLRTSNREVPHLRTYTLLNLYTYSLI